MSSHYQSLTRDTLFPEAFRADAPEPPPAREIVPRRPAPFIRRAADSASCARELAVGQFGLVPAWVKSASDARLRSLKLTQARAETVATATAFREAWLASQRCIVPMMAFFADDLRSGQALPTRIARVDGQPLGAAGLWSRWQGPEGEEILSFALITVNADQHALMRRYQHEGSEKRMPALLNEGAYDAWLAAPPEKAADFLRAYPAQALLANPVEGRKKTP